MGKLVRISPDLPSDDKLQDIDNFHRANETSFGQIRSLIKILHKTMRDNEGNSSLIERFDELTKIIYCKAYDERDHKSNFIFDKSKSKQDYDRINEIRQYFKELVNRRTELFPIKFREINISDETVLQLMDILAGYRISETSEDLKGVLFEELIKNTFDKGDNQQFFTPRPIVEFMVHMIQLIGDNLQGIICDPACGTGGFLLYVDKYIKEKGIGSQVQLLGFEIDERLAWVAGINLDMHNAVNYKVKCLNGGGSLGKEMRNNVNSIDVIITNPPFGSDFTDQESLSYFELGRNRLSRRRGILFIERCLELLKPGGLLAIIIDDGVLNGPSNIDVRRLICQKSIPFAIISLPATAFMPYASVKASILFLEKYNEHNFFGLKEGTFFASAETVGKKPSGDPLFKYNKSSKRLELDSDLPQILTTWKNIMEDTFFSEEKYGSIGFISKITNIKDKLFTKDGYRLDLAYHHPARHEAMRALKKSPYPINKLNEICDVSNELVIPSRDFAEEDITYLGLANIDSYMGTCNPLIINGSSLKSAVRRFKGGDILFARMRPELRKVCLVPENIEEGFASSECIVLTPRKSLAGEWLVLPKLLSILLRSDVAYGQLVHMVTGIGRPRINRQVILNIKIPVPPINEQNNLLELYEESEKISNSLISKSERALEKSREVIGGAHKLLVNKVLFGHFHYGIKD